MLGAGSEDGDRSSAVWGTEMSEWQPIATAPIPQFDQKRWYDSGAPIMVTVNGRVSIARYSYTERGKGRWIERGYGCVCTPTHWMPLPLPATA